MTKLTGDKLVAVRNEMVSDLDKACGVFADDKLDRKELAWVLTRIAQTDGYTVDTGCEEEFHGFTKQTGKHVKITEEGSSFYIRVYELADKKGVYRTDYCHYDLQTEAEQRAEAQWEQDADNAYEKYLDYKASMDDPRGQ